MKRPLNLLLCPVGTIGDWNPMLALATEMVERGHRVTMIGNDAFSQAAVNVGAEFVGVHTADRLEYLKRPECLSYQDGYRRHLPVQCLEPLKSTYDALAARNEPGRTVIVAANWSFGARIAQESLGIPTVTLHTDPHTLRSARGIYRMPRPMIVGDWVFRWFMRLQFYVADRFYIDPLCRTELNRFRAEFGLAPMRRVMHQWWNSPDMVLAAFPDWWGAPQPEWPKQTHVVGFPVYDAAPGQGLSAETLQFLDAGTKPIVFSPGNSHLHTKAYFQAAIEACRRLGRRGILITKRREEIASSLSDDILHLNYAPFQALLPQASAVVHHAGVGSIAAALRAGVPQVSIPSNFNQPDAAARAERLGVGRTVHESRVSADTLARALRQLLDDPAVEKRCREIAGRFGPREEPARRTTDLVESLIAEKAGMGAR
ncbi:MAG: glycosyltransferase [Planctomycetia bacterium]|nr:glycosyltransferase [Planctomycetia bacterium]